MAAPFDPDAYLKEKADFDPDAYLAGDAPDFAPESPLGQALKSQTGDVVTVQTPTGPAKFTRQGQRFYDPEESQRLMEGSLARGKERMLEEGLTFLGGGGKLMDEARGADAAVASAVRGGSPSEAYYRVRDETRRDVTRATEKSPTVEVGGVRFKPVALAGAAAPMMAAPVAGTVASRVLSGAFGAGLDELGGSTAPTAQGVARDVGNAAAWGAGTSGAMELAAAPLRAVGARAAREAELAREALLESTQGARDKAARSAMSSLGGIVSAQGNAAETIGDVLRNPHLYPQDVVNEANRFIQSPEGRTLMARAASNNMERMPGLMGREEQAREALRLAREAASPEAVGAEVAQRLEPSTLARELGGKAWNSVGQRAALGALGSGAGATAAWVTGQDPKAGAGLGFVGGAAMPPGALQFLRNQSRSPATQFGANALIERAIGAETSGLARAATAATPVGRTMTRQELSKEEDDAITAFLAGGN